LAKLRVVCLETKVSSHFRERGITYMQDPPRVQVWKSVLDKFNLVIREPQEEEGFFQT